MSQHHQTPYIHVLPPLDEPEEPAGLQHVRFLAKLMDAAITLPILRKKIGLDPLLGLCPVVGDVVTGLVATYTLYVGYKLGLPKWALIRMTGNILLDTTLGNVPVVGDVFDWLWKANIRNLAILETEYAKIRSQEQAKIIPFPHVHHHTQPFQAQAEYAQTAAAYAEPAPARHQVVDIDLNPHI